MDAPVRFRLAALGSLAAIMLAGCAVPGDAPLRTVTSDKIYVAERGSNQVAVLDDTSLSVIKTIPVGTAPVQFAFADMREGERSRLWVANSGSHSVTEINTQTDAIVRTVDVGIAPEFLAGAGNYLYVAGSGSKTIKEINALDGSIAGSIQLANMPLGLASADLARDVVAGEQGGIVELVEMQSDVVAGNFTASGPLAGAGLSDNATNARLDVVTTNGNVEMIDGSNINFTAQGTFTVPPGASSVLSRGEVYIFNAATGQVSLVQREATSPSWTVTAGRNPSGADYDSSARRTIIANSGDASLTFVGSNGTVTGTHALPSGSEPSDVVEISSAITATPTPAPSATPTLAPTATPTPVQTATPTPSPAPAGNDVAYVADYLGNGLDQFDAPFSADTAPTQVFGQSNPYGIAAHGNTLAVTSTDNDIEIYSLPLTAPLSPLVTTGSNYNGGDAFDPSGNLWVTTTGNTVVEFTPPFSAGMVPSKTVSGFGQSNAIAFDSNANMYVTVSGGYSEIAVSSPPYTAISTVLFASGATSYQGVAVSGSRLAVADVAGSRVLIYALPLSSSSTPAFSVTTAGQPIGVAFDSAGNLFVSTVSNGVVSEYAAPLSASSTPAAVLKPVPQGGSGSTSGPNGIAVLP